MKKNILITLITLISFSNLFAETINFNCFNVNDEFENTFTANGEVDTECENGTLELTLNKNNSTRIKEIIVNIKFHINNNLYQMLTLETTIAGDGFDSIIIKMLNSDNIYYSTIKFEETTYSSICHYSLVE